MSSCTYDIARSYDENYAEGPFFSGEFPPLPATPGYRFLGIAVNSPLGVPAGPLLNARWIQLYARLGFDLLVYKTVRSTYRKCHPAPNCLFLKDPGNLTPDRFRERLVATPDAPADPTEISITNSFGMPSRDPKSWQADMEQAVKACAPGQLMIASCVGTPGQGDIADDYARAASMVRETGAPLVEINLSCPNVTTGEGSIFTDPEQARRITRAVHTALRGIPLIIKVGYYEKPETLRDVVKACAPFVQAISGINTLSFEVVKEDGTQALPGEGRLRSGVCGAAIRGCGLTQTKRLAELKASEKYDFEIVGVGGIMTAGDADDYLAAGAHAVMSATGAMWDPLLAARWRKRRAGASAIR